MADLARDEGVWANPVARRGTYSHAGALIADAILQAGLNYRSVVRPRVERILNEYPETNRVSALTSHIDQGQTALYLNWKHPTKVERFEKMVRFLHAEHVDTHEDLRNSLRSEQFCLKLLSLHGVGHKTVDYMACLVGIESIAVDRHIRSYAARAGVQNAQYIFLKNAFCFAADLLSISRREFDAWVWSRETQDANAQLTLHFENPHSRAISQAAT